jgi:glycosyltransferase involved in cell wall biosynthesis
VRDGRSDTLVVLPTFNERENLERVVNAVRQSGYDVLVVDDASPDGTGELAARLAERDAGVRVHGRPRKLGLGSAYVEGFSKGLQDGYQLFVEMDADGSHRAEHLDAIVEAARSAGGMAIGSRYVSGGAIVGWGPARHLLSWGANVYCRALLGLGVHDCTSGFRCYTRQVLERIGLERVVSQGYSFQIEMVYRCARLGYPIVETPIRFEDRIEGKSKVSEGEVRKALLAVLRLRFSRWW